MAKRRLTILHSNDLHGDFLPKEVDGVMTGGIARLSGYVRQARRESNDAVLYAIAGDMFRGSIIDSEYRGLSTIELVNVLAPDIATVGNHEVDYGLAHLLFLEKCAMFPIINANLFVTMNNARLFEPYRLIRAGGINVLFIGVLTDEVIATTKTEAIIGSFVDIEEAAREVGVICDNYRTRHVDLTVLLTHIGIEQDRELARLLNPDFGVNLIIGGHSHTFMEEPEVVNGIPIVQAGCGTGVIGRLDLTVGSLLSSSGISELVWTLVPVNELTAPVDDIMLQTIEIYRDATDRKYKRLVTRWARQLTHPSRTQETEMGNLYADLMQDESSFDVMFFASGAIRKQELGPLIEVQDMLENTPFDGPIYMLKVTGAQLRRMVIHLMRDEAWEGHTEFYQVSRGMRIVWRKSTHTLEELKLNGQDVTDEQEILIAIQEYHYLSFTEFFGVPVEEVAANMKPRVVAVSQNNIIEEYFSTHQNLDAHVEGRIVVLE